MQMGGDAFREAQRAYHAKANPRHFRWQTRAPYFAGTEAALLSKMSLGPGERLLEVGCGEGGNLYHLRTSGAVLFGVDFSPEKVAFARAQTGARIEVADATALPYPDGHFDAVLIRDLLHHLPDRTAAIREAHRVLKPGGRLYLYEPNRAAPLVLLQAALIKAERGLLRSTATRLEKELTQVGFRIEQRSVLQPFPIARVLLHPEFGSERLGEKMPVAFALDTWNTVFTRLFPRRAWLYLFFSAIK